jgi:hypothetical protein
MTRTLRMADARLAARNRPGQVDTSTVAPCARKGPTRGRYLYRTVQAWTWPPCSGDAEGRRCQLSRRIEIPSCHPLFSKNRGGEIALRRGQTADFGALKRKR